MQNKVRLGVIAAGNAQFLLLRSSVRAIMWSLGGWLGTGITPFMRLVPHFLEQVFVRRIRQSFFFFHYSSVVYFPDRSFFCFVEQASTNAAVLYANRTEDDILCKATLQRWTERWESVEYLDALGRSYKCSRFATSKKRGKSLVTNTSFASADRSALWISSTFFQSQLLNGKNALFIRSPARVVQRSDDDSYSCVPRSGLTGRVSKDVIERCMPQPAADTMVGSLSTHAHKTNHFSLSVVFTPAPLGHILEMHAKTLLRFWYAVLLDSMELRPNTWFSSGTTNPCSTCSHNCGMARAST